jgi:hypothetical protein
MRCIVQEWVSKHDSQLLQPVQTLSMEDKNGGTENCNKYDYVEGRL